METTPDTTTKPRIAFWGTPEFALPVLEALHAAGLTPELVITVPDKPLGRKQIMTPPATKVWAEKYGIRVDQPEKLKEYTPEGNWDLFVVAAYGKIIPQRILDIPKYGNLNIHPSLLPKFRGPSPVQTSVLEGVTETGVSVMLLDAQMDHGPILAEAPYTATGREMHIDLTNTLFQIGGAMLVEIIPIWIAGTVVPQEQDHTAATITRKFITEDGLLDFKTMSAVEIDRRVRALNPEPGTFTYFEDNGKKLRLKILETDIVEGKLILKSVQPEGKTPMTGESFKKRYGIEL